MSIHDSRDGEDLMRALRDEVIPLYYQRDRDGLPRGWIKRMKRTIRTLGWRFNADRMIGVGMQGSGLLAQSITIPGVECVGAADLYDGRHTLAREITANPSLPTTRKYQELLDRKDIDCIVAAVPDHWHRRVVVDA